MELSKLLEERRSVRSYKAGAEVPKTDIEEMIRAAQQAPSWKNSETGRYYVISSPEKLAEARENCLPEFNRKNSAGAPVLIVTAYERSVSGFSPDGVPANELGDKWGAYDLGLQNENLILKARELGYDTLIMGIRDESALRKLLSVPESQDIAAVIAVGVRDADPKAPQRKELGEIVKFF